MGDVTTDPLVHGAFSVALAALFASTAVHKLKDVRSFSETMRQYRLLPEPFVVLFAVVLIKCEMILAIGLCLPDWRPLAGFGAAVLLMLYSMAIAINLVRGRRNIDCGCLGPGQRQPISEWLLLRNATVALAAIIVTFEPTARRFVWLDAVSMLGLVAILAFVWISSNRLMETWPRVRAL